MTTRERSITAIEHRVLYALVFTLCLALAALARLAPGRWHPWRAPGERARPLLAEARAAADSAVPYVFQVS